MNGRFAADPLDISRSALSSPRNRVAKELGRENLTAAWVKRKGFGYTKHATQVAARQVEQVRRDKFGLFAILDAMPKEAHRVACLAGPAFSHLAICPAAMLAELTALVVRAGQSNGFARGRSADHRASTADAEGEKRVCSWIASF